MSAEEDARFPFRRLSLSSIEKRQQTNDNNVTSYKYESYSDYNGHPAKMTAQAHDFQDVTGAPLAKTDTIGSISLTPEQFERMYLGPQNQVKGDLRKTFANPPPVGLAGLLIALSPITCQFMGWRGTHGAEGIPTVGFTIFIGGVVSILAGIGEFVLGNSFPCLFLIVFGGFFLGFGATLVPSFGAYAAFAANRENSNLWLTQGAVSPQFAGSIGFVSVFMGLFGVYCTICALRTNLCFVLAFICLDLAFFFLAASRFYLVQEDLVNYEHFELIAGAAGFGLISIGWYILLAEALTTVDFPINLPVFDLSTYIPGASDLAKKKKKHQDDTNGTV